MKKLISRSEEKLNPTEGNNPRPPATPKNAPKPKSPHPKRPEVPAISNGRMRNLNLNEPDYRSRQGSFDVNQRLTYNKVMNRVIKRFLLHKQREEQEVIHESDFEELKQDIQMLRFEMLNRLEETRHDLHKNSELLNEGIVIVGELLSTIANDSNPLIKENFHLFKKSFYSRTDSGIESNASTNSTTAMSNIVQFTPNTQQESDIHPEYALRSLSLAHVGLQKIVEEEEMETVHKTLRFIDDVVDDEGEEVPARHMSIQTSTDKNNKLFSKF
jgi:hypothetical protein